jgi:hypothetical protein
MHRSKATCCLAGLLAACAASAPEREPKRDAAQADAADMHEQKPEPVGAEPLDGGSARADGSVPPLDATQQPADDAARDAAGAPEASSAVLKQSWPTPDAPMAVDERGAFSNNLSALSYEPAQGSTPARLWAVQNEPPVLFRLLWDGALWKADAAEGWAGGKVLHFPSGSGRPDTEGVALPPSAGGARFLYMASERDTDSATGRQSVLRFDVSASGTTLTATHEWNLTSAIPTTALNMGLEAIAFVPDAAAAGLLDESRGRSYESGAYGEHGGGLFLVGVEAAGTIHAFVLDHQSSTATRVASSESGLPGVMALEFDGDSGYLWAHCDDACGNRTTLLELDQGSGRFVVRRELAPPAGTQSLGHEGLTIAPDAECSEGRKSIFWAEDRATDGRAIRRGSIPCGRAW